MILDTIHLASRYATLHPAFEQAFRFLAQGDLNTLAPGRYELDGANLYANVEQTEGRGKETARLEAHREYIDIQFVLSGVEIIGWKACMDCAEDKQGYDMERDIEFFTDKPDVWLQVNPGQFVILFPEDAHAPLAGTGSVAKVVVKVLAD